MLSWLSLQIEINFLTVRSVFVCENFQTNQDASNKNHGSAFASSCLKYLISFLSRHIKTCFLVKEWLAHCDLPAGFDGPTVPERKSCNCI